jgi:hypothetical protein
MIGVGAAIGGSLALAAVSTIGDFIWATWLPQHRAIYGLVHGTVLFLAMGGCLGWMTGRPGAGAAAGAAIGLLGAGGFYLLAPLLGFSAMFVAWCGVWIAFAFLYGRLSRGRAPLGTLLSRGIVAAVASGLGFYLISGIWRPFNPQGLDYAVHFGAWTLAYVPGFAALLISRRQNANRT